MSDLSEAMVKAGVAVDYGENDDEYVRAVLAAALGVLIESANQRQAIAVGVNTLMDLRSAVEHPEDGTR